jgi:putative transposase
MLGTPVRASAVRFHSAGLPLRATEAILRLIGLERSFHATFQWLYRLSYSFPVLPKTKPGRVAVDETAIKINGEWSWLNATIDLDTKVSLHATLFKGRGTNPAATFLFGLAERNDHSDAEFLVEQFGYRTALARLGLNSRVDYTDRNLIEKWSQTLKIRVDRFHNSWVANRRSVRR